MRKTSQHRLTEASQMAQNLDGATAFGAPQLVYRRVVDLQPHPRYLELRAPVTAAILFQLEQRGAALFDEPFLVSDTGIILDGYAGWLLAQQQGREQVRCLVHSFATEAALVQALLRCQQRHQQSLTAFGRIVLALELEPVLREQAREHQHRGREMKGSSTLTKADPLDVRAEIAKVAGVAAGNVSKVKQILDHGCPEVLAALRQGAVSIHQALGWSQKSPAQQRRLLGEWQTRKDLHREIQRLVARHKTAPQQQPPTLSELVARLTGTPLPRDDEVDVLITEERTMRLYLSRPLLEALSYPSRA